MAHQEDDHEIDKILSQTPGIQIFLQPIAPPAALGLAGFAGSTWITSSYIANWWGNPDSPTIFFPFVGIFGGVAQFIAGIYGFRARDTLVTIINTMWGSFWISIGILYAFVVSVIGAELGRSMLTSFRLLEHLNHIPFIRISRNSRHGLLCSQSSRGPVPWPLRHVTSS